MINIDDEGNTFELNDKALLSVLSSVPPTMAVSVVSVVGAFRTGKSFMLDWMLRYLNATSGKPVDASDEPDETWMNAGGSQLEGNHNAGGKDKSYGFGWRSGRERMTTGIWMWSEHFVRTMPETGEQVAVLLVDTQGMFDSSLTQMLTASIFGLSTLISSYQVYNVDKQIQEDNLQHLALFTEYGRVALREQRNEEKSDPEWYSTEDGETSGKGTRPFQRVEFLVRDWQNFDDEDEEPMPEMLEDMNVYLQEVMSKTMQKDTREVREQIHDCFETVSCFLLPHPGHEVTSKKYDGSVDKIRPSFRRLMSEYLRRVFSSRLMVKKIHGRSVTSMELFEFIRAYAKLFKEAKIFPEAQTLLAATAEANNRAALDRAVQSYKAEMDKLAGPGRIYCADNKLKEHHLVCRSAAGDQFKVIASIGPRAAIREYKERLDKEITFRYRDYKEANRLRDPFGFVGPYVLPLLVALVAMVFAWLMNNICGKTCAGPAFFFTSVYLTIFTFLAVQLLVMGEGVRLRIKQMYTTTKFIIQTKAKLS